MEEFYRKILEKRNHKLQEELIWSKEFAKSLVREKVLSRECVQEIERENGSRNRIFRLLAKFPQQSSPGVFGGLYRSLRQTNQDELAELLDYDRRQIVWDFQSCGEVNSLAEYINVIEDQLIRRLPDEHDQYIQEAIMQELRMRIRLLARYIKQHSYRNRKFHQELQKVCQLSNSEGEWEQEEAHINLMEGSGFATLEDWECGRDDYNLQQVANYVQRVREDRRLLQEEVSNLKRQLMHHEEEKLESCNLDRISADQERKQERKISILEDTIKQQDMELVMFKGERKHEEEFVHIPKPEFEKLLNALYPYVRKSSNIDPVPLLKDKKRYSSKYMARLQDDLNVVLRQIDRLRGRIQEMTEHITQLERERALISETLHIREVSPEMWAERLLDTFSSVEEDRSNMQDEIDSLRRRITAMGEEQERMLAKIRDMMEADKMESKDEEKESTPKVRQRRCSAISQGTPAPKLSLDTKTRRSTVAGCTPKGRPVTRPKTGSATKNVSLLKDQCDPPLEEQRKPIVKLHKLSLGINPHRHA